MDEAELAYEGDSPEYVIVLAGPKTPANVGSVARAMANFGSLELRIVKGVPLGDEAKRLAYHAGSIIDHARHYETFERALEGLDLVVGTSGVSNKRENRHLRNPLTPAQLSERLTAVKGKVGLVFGREDYGLFNEELERCDLLMTIPTAPIYPIMNLSHAVAVVLYELRRDRRIQREATELSEVERDRLLDAFDELFAATDYPSHKLPGTRIMVRRILGRATLSKWEYHTLMGVVTRPARQIVRLEGEMRAAGLDPKPKIERGRKRRKNRKKKKPNAAKASEGNTDL